MTLAFSLTDPLALAAVKHFNIKLMLKVIAWVNSQKHFNPMPNLVLALHLTLHTAHTQIVIFVRLPSTY